MVAGRAPATSSKVIFVFVFNFKLLVLIRKVEVLLDEIARIRVIRRRQRTRNLLHNGRLRRRNVEADHANEQIDRV